MARYLVLFFILLFCPRLLSQTDTLVFDLGNKVIGEIKGMNKGVLEIDAPYGDQNFKVKWLDIQEIYTESKFVVSIKEQLFQGRLASIENQRIKVYDNDSTYATCQMNYIRLFGPF